ncbi:CRISPR-associated protein Csx10 [Sinosporangium album]|uniref:CRISPR-associated protein Csx10 n=1 Tax=Sinosporangium album TaxID=504805 RepID=A0A1G7VRE6_9ACTN|nr:RAMP superfamily CRISPR-associated protein [Sinosporangium album]SDG62386.1 CRISPR-associated protein Csx10 [Sinosporangium album]
MSETGDFTLSLFMVSDWCIGTGTGIHGLTDRLVQRDETDGIGLAAPVVPAKTVIGVWRDSCELAAHALDSGPVGVWHEWVTYLFGGQYGTADRRSPSPAALALSGPLRLPDQLATLLGVKPRVAWATTFRKPGVAIDPHAGTAKPDMLRFEEMARAGLTMRGAGRIERFDALDARQRKAAFALLGAGAQLLETIGGKRRRGAGRCRMTLEGPAITLPDLDGVPAPPMGSPYALADRPDEAPRPTGPGWETVEVVITVKQPVLAAATVLGNVVEGADHIPGWCLMPEVARRLGGAAHAMVRAGDLVVTSATPQSSNGTRTLPVPRVLIHAKNDKRTVIGNVLHGAEEPGRPTRTGFVAPEGGRTLVIPPSTLRMHNTIQDDLQRPTRDVGGVYVYCALAAGTVLRAEVRARAGMLASGWEKRLAGRWRVGRSAKDDYGQVQVDARRAPAVPPDRDMSGGQLRVWLLSDLLIRDERLRPSTAPADVARALETAFHAAGADTVRLAPTNPNAAGETRTESWHRGWNLPRASLYGIAAGSCLTFTVADGALDQAALAEVRAAGVGERRAEGFGQVEFDHPLLTQPVVAHSPVEAHESTPAAPPALIAPGEEGYADARVFERAAWRTEIHRSCERIMGDDAERAQVIPASVSSSQLNALREITSDMSPGRAQSFLEWLTKPKAGRTSWPPDGVVSMRTLLTDPNRVWKLLNLPESELVITSDGVEALRGELRGEALKGLIDACLAAHSRSVAMGRIREGSAK